MTAASREELPEAAAAGRKNPGNGRARSHRRQLAVIRSGIRMLSAVSPPLAGRVAMALFRKPPRHAEWEREREILAMARPSPFSVRGRRVAAWTWGDGDPVLLVHGWGSTGGRLGSLVEPLVASGFSVVAFDAPGHGASGGWQSSLPEFLFSIEAAAGRFGRFSGIVGHSLGGAATALAIGRGLAAERAVFLAPSSNPAGYTRQFAEALGLPSTVRERMETTVERLFGIPWSAFDVLAAARRATVPGLVIHDRGDSEVPWSEGEALARAWPGAELVTTRGLGHTRIVHDAEVVRRAVRFLAEPPSGRSRVVPDMSTIHPA
jgi:pimeloyl-ACP methyl ester carboxylesterase